MRAMLRIVRMQSKLNQFYIVVVIDLMELFLTYSECYKTLYETVYRGKDTSTCINDDLQRLQC